MKAALLSFHNGCNYGAALQAYALQEAVASLGVDCEYINYVNTHRKELYDMRARFRKAIRQRDLKRVMYFAPMPSRCEDGILAVSTYTFFG